MFIAVTPITYPEDQRILLNLAHVLAMTEDGPRVGIEIAPERTDRGERVIVRGSLAGFEDLPGLFRTTLVRPHGDPVPALVNLPAMLRADPCPEGTLLATAMGSHARKFLIGSSFTEVEAHLLTGG